MLILVLHGHVYLKFDVLLVDFESLDMDFPSKETIPKPIQNFLRYNFSFNRNYRNFRLIIFLN